MYDKQSFSKFILFIFIFIMSCDSSENNLVRTVWETSDGKIVCKFTSKNTLEIKYNNIQKKFLFYQVGKDIRITNIDDYSQHVIKIKDNKLIMDSEGFSGLKTDKSNTEFTFMLIFNKDSK